MLNRGQCLNTMSLQKSREEHKKATFSATSNCRLLCLCWGVGDGSGCAFNIYDYIIYNMSQQQVQKGKKIKIVGDYAIGRTIGNGTFANVKQAIHQKTSEKVSIKILHKKLLTQTRDKINLSRELRILKRVRHPNIAQLLQTFETNSNIYIVMEYVQNGQLFNMIVQNKKGRLTQATASAFFQQLINAVDYLHSIGVAHRDIKPENILIDHQNNVKLIDFGLSNFFQKEQKLFTSCGSPCYAPPEMLVEQSYDPRLADIWSCGIVLYAMICGFLPFEDKSNKVLYQKIKEGIYEQPKHMSIVAKDLISKILKFNPQERISIAEIRKHSFCSPFQPITRGLMPSQTLKLDDRIVEKMNLLGYFSFKTDVENHRNSSNTVAYYLLLYKQLKEDKESLINYFNNQFKQEYVKSPFRSKSLMLKRGTEHYESNKGSRKSTVHNEEEEQFLDKLYLRNQKNLSEKKSLNIRVRKIVN